MPAKRWTLIAIEQGNSRVYSVAVFSMFLSFIQHGGAMITTAIAMGDRREQQLWNDKYLIFTDERNRVALREFGHSK